MLAEAEKQISKGAKGAWVSEAVWRKIVFESHRPVGVLLARKWNLPPEVASTLEGCNTYDCKKPRSSANIVCLANTLAKRSGLYVGDVDQDEVEKTDRRGPAAGRHLGRRKSMASAATSTPASPPCWTAATGKNVRPGR